MGKRIFNVVSMLFVFASLAVGVYLVGIKTGFIKKAGGVPANLVIDAGSHFPNPADCWKSLAQGGESKSRMLVSVIPQTKKLSPRYIRIDHIYDNYDVVSRNGGQLVFNWQNLDQTVNDILAIGATPFFSLSYMPPSISKDGKVESTPTSWADWQVVVQRTIEHYSGKSSMNLSNVYYEVWNEPDLYGGFKPGGAKNYLDLYYYAQLGAQSAAGVKPFKIGGPATTALYKSWVDAIMKMAVDGRVRVDFLSWHTYSRDVDKYDKDIQDVSAWLASYPNFANMELVISELGINSENDPAFDNNLSAIYAIASTSVIQGNINKCFNFEIIDGVGPTQYWGRWGLLTNEKFGTPVAKPRYYAIQFLNNMAGDRMSVGGMGSWIKAFARFDGTKIRVMVVNYDPEGVHNEAVPITINNIPFTNFKVTRTNFLGGSQTLSTVANTNTWSATLGFTPNSAAIFTIEPL